jgi:hypothetical protein
MNQAGRTRTELEAIARISAALSLALGLLCALGCTNTLRSGSDGLSTAPQK